MFERELVKSVSGREVNMFEIGKRLFNGYNPIRILRDDLGRRLADEDCIHEHARDEGVCMEVVEIAIIEQMLKLAPYCEQEVERKAAEIILYTCDLCRTQILNHANEIPKEIERRNKKPLARHELDRQVETLLHNAGRTFHWKKIPNALAEAKMEQLLSSTDQASARRVMSLIADVSSRRPLQEALQEMGMDPFEEGISEEEQLQRGHAAYSALNRLCKKFERKLQRVSGY